MELTEENKKQFLIPEGFAHGFLVLSDVAEFCYKVTDFWHLGDESGLAWNDPAIGIKWPQLVGEYPGSADGSGYTLEDGTPINLSEMCIRDSDKSGSTCYYNIHLKSSLIYRCQFMDANLCVPDPIKF